MATSALTTVMTANLACVLVVMVKFYKRWNFIKYISCDSSDANLIVFVETGSVFSFYDEQFASLGSNT